MRRFTCCLLASALVACATTDDPDLSDADAEGGDEQALGTNDPLVGVYRWTYADRPYWANDITALQITGGGYVRARCYGYDCAKLVPQLGDLSVTRSSGKTYLKFKSFDKVQEGEEWVEVPATL